ncbi:elongator complex protein 4 [Phlebotomus argentipes]|uniref:elongator complex protein 4 n=1 Tax=Phlebotomus argentipes TaxID=94469 RepID=UPI002892FC65|nr:elongator complex protein 4 [Phlebotomus argentipes]
MSFQLKRKLLASIEGCRPSLHNGQLMVSTGNFSLDHIIGGGLPLGSILLIEEDKYNSYAKVLCRYFLAEGVYRRHPLFLATKEEPAHDFVRKLPQAVEEEIQKVIDKRPAEEEMRIAWRYNDLPRVSLEQGSRRDYHFDLSKSVTPEAVKACSVTCWGDEGCFAELEKSIGEKLSEQHEKCLRICLKSLGSPLWWTRDDFPGKLVRFLTLLKSRMRSSTSVCMISMPTHLFACLDKSLLARVRDLVDFCVEIESFSGADAETNVMYREYHGLVHIHKLSALNTLAPFRPETYDLAFKQRRKRFVVEKLHLPPDISELSDTLIPRPSFACTSGASGARGLDF